jgi:hypothetical protein
VDAGCTAFVFHTDSVCDEALAFLGKKIRIAEIERTIDMACQVEGAHVEYYLFSGIPKENFRNMVALAKFTAKATFKCRRKLDNLYISRMRIYPHTLLYENAVREGRIGRDTNMLSPAFYGSNYESAGMVEDILTLILTKSTSILRRFFKAYT